MLPTGNENVTTFNFSVPLPTLPPPNHRCPSHRSSPPVRAEPSSRVPPRPTPTGDIVLSRGVRMAPRRFPLPTALLAVLAGTVLTITAPAPAAAATTHAAVGAASVATTGPRFVDIATGGPVLKANVV